MSLQPRASSWVEEVLAEEIHYYVSPLSCRRRGERSRSPFESREPDEELRLPVGDYSRSWEANRGTNTTGSATSATFGTPTPSKSVKGVILSRWSLPEQAEDEANNIEANNSGVKNHLDGKGETNVTQVIEQGRAVPIRGGIEDPAPGRCRQLRRA